MDIQLESKSVSTFRWYLGGGIAFLALMLFLLFPSGNNTVLKSYSAEDLNIASVNEETVQIRVSGYGHLRSSTKRILTAPAAGIISEIFKRPGENIRSEVPILEIVNPKIDEDISALELDLLKQEADIQALRSDIKKEEIKSRVMIISLTNEYEKELFKHEAEKKLSAAGIVSVINFKSTQLNVRHLKTQLDLEQQALEEQKNANEQKLLAQQNLLQQLNVRMNVLQKQQADMQLVGGIVGQVQELKVEAGESVILGQALAVVGSNTDLFAELQVPQSKADTIKLGNVGIINLRPGTVHGKVSRIEPVVVDGTVLIELRFENQLPERARPELAIEGEILVKEEPYAIVVEKPLAVRENSSGLVYVLNSEGSEAESILIRTGLISGSKIIVEEGLQQGDRVITNDLAVKNEKQLIKIR
jgi:HlyD family secretion protein